MLYLFNRNFEEVDIIETYKSLIWTTRYYEAGDFELYIPASVETIELYRKAVDEGWYLVDSDDTTVAMMITRIKLEDEYDNGQYLSVTGYCLKHLLNRRVIWGKTYLAGSLEGQLRKIVYDNAINPDDANRIIPGLYLGEESHIDIMVNYELSAGPIDTTIASICKTYRVGWDIRLNLLGDSDHRFEFIIFNGTDRLNEVVFSNDFDNLLSSEYDYNIEKFKNSCFIESYVTSVNEETNEIDRDPFYFSINRKTPTINNISGFDRYETCISASSDGKMSDIAAYQESLLTSAKKQLISNKYDEKISGTVIPDLTFDFNKDYYLGDLCHAENGYGMLFKTRVTEVITTKNNSEISTIPTFVVEEDDEDDKPRVIEEEDCRLSESGSDYRISEDGALRIKEEIVIESRVAENGEDRITENSTGRDIVITEESKELISKWEVKDGS